jgi:hypothetical protein
MDEKLKLCKTFKCKNIKIILLSQNLFGIIIQIIAFIYFSGIFNFKQLCDFKLINEDYL